VVRLGLFHRRSFVLVRGGILGLFHYFLGLEIALLVASEPLMCRFKAAFALPLSRKTFRIAAEQAPRLHTGC
jgi:hypothetical protein